MHTLLSKYSMLLSLIACYTFLINCTELLYIYQNDVMLFIITEFDLYTVLYSFVHVWCLKSSAEAFSYVLFRETC